MKTNDVQLLNQTTFKNKQIIKDENKAKTPEQKKNGAKLLATGATAIATLAIAGLMLYKKPKSFSDIQFSKGIAYKTNGDLFTGIAKKTTKKGDVFKVHYKDGKIIESWKNNSLLKTYSYTDALGDGNTTIVQSFDKANKKAKVLFYSDGKLVGMKAPAKTEIYTYSYNPEKINIEKLYKKLGSDFKIYSDELQANAKKVGINLNEIPTKASYNRLLRK